MPGTRPNPVRAAIQWQQALEHEFDALTGSNARWGVGGLQRSESDYALPPLLQMTREERLEMYRKERKEREERHMELVDRINNQPFARSLCGWQHHKYINKNVPGKVGRQAVDQPDEPFRHEYRKHFLHRGIGGTLYQDSYAK